MRLPLTVIFILLMICPARAQQNYYPQQILPVLDSLFIAVHQQQQQKDTAGLLRFVQQTDALLQPHRQAFPLFTGIIHLHQAYYATDPAVQHTYLQQAIALLKNGGPVLADVFHVQLLWLIESFYEENRARQWAPVDSLLRYAVLGNEPKAQFHYALTNYADKQLNAGAFGVVKSLAAYEKLFFKNIAEKSPYNKITLLYNKWLLLRSDLDQWFTIPYANRNNSNYTYKGRMQPIFLTDKPEYKALNKINYKEQFLLLFKELEGLSKEMVLDNTRQSAKYQEGYRVSYYNLYNSILHKFYEWAISDYRHSEALLPLKKFLFQDLIVNEVNPALQLKQPSVFTADNLALLFARLSALYYAAGNGAEASQVVLRGQKFFLNNDGFTTDQQFNAVAILAPHAIRAARLEGRLDAALRAATLMKSYTPAPDSLDKNNLNAFEWYAEARYEEVYTLLAMQQKDRAVDSLTGLIDAIGDIAASDTDFIYTTRAWTHLQFLATGIQTRAGKWNYDLINEMLNDLLDNKTALEIFYPAQLLQLKAILKKYGRVSEMDLANLLIYTQRQLQHNFILLTAEERMRLYEHRLNPYFDVYHELLFTGQLDSMPALKEQVIAQSLYLKNAMADGNVLSDEIFTNGHHGISKNLLNDLRRLRQQAKMSYQTALMRNYNTEQHQEGNDNLQTLWLKVLDGPGRDSLVAFPDWKKMSRQLKTGEVYIETIRYSRWLSDSAAVYSAYVLQAGQPIQLINICKEDTLVALLKDPAASPQTASLDAQHTRGTGLLNGTVAAKKSFKAGDIDRLGRLILQPIWARIAGSKKLFLVQDGLLNRISFAALQWQQQYLLQYVQLQQLSASYMLGAAPMPKPAGTKALLSGGLQYGSTPDSFNFNRLLKPALNWNYLPGTLAEMNALQTMFAKAGYQNRLLSGNEFSDTLRKSMEGYSFIHLATHGFYFDTAMAKAYYADRLNREAIKNEPLFRCGIAVSGANDPSANPQLETQGYLLGYELANTDLRNCYLVALSACETGLGDVRNNLGVDGLSRALKIGGARHLLISLWKVPDAATAVFMKQFYTFLFAGKPPAAALQATQRLMSKTYSAASWGAFIVVE